jgi:hypothetical protein
MTLIDIFEHILDGFSFSEEKVNDTLMKAEDTIHRGINNTLDLFK